MDGVDVGSLFRAYHRRLVGSLRCYLGCELAAEEVAQEAYLSVWRATAAGEVKYPRAYLFRTAEHLAFDRLEREAVERRHRAEAPLSEAIVAPGPSPEAQLLAEQCWAIVACAFNELPPACREAFVLHKLQGLRHAEVALRLGISKSMVEKHIMRALAHCRSRLRERG